MGTFKDYEYIRERKIVKYIDYSIRCGPTVVTAIRWGSTIVNPIRCGPRTRAVLRLVCPYILLQSARGHVATAAKSVAVSRLWCAVPVKQRTTLKKNVIRSLCHHQNVTHCWHHGTRHT